MIPENLSPLKSYRQWVNWRRKSKFGRPVWDFEKVPLQVCSRPETWLTFEEAQRRAAESPGLGIGIQMNGPPFVAWDLDWKSDPAYEADEHGFKTIPEKARRIIEQQNSYTEWSPSGRGARIICSGSLEKDLDLPGIGQIFGEPRKHFVTITGNTILDTDIKPYKSSLTQLPAESRSSGLMETGRNNDLQKEAGRIMARGEARSEEELIERLKLHAKFRHAGETDEKKLLDMARRAWVKYQGDAPKTLVTSMETIVDEKLDWLWEGKVPLCHLTMFVGQPGVGKSSMAQHLAADLSRKGIRTLILNAEEHVPTATKPRLRAMGADLEKIALVQVEQAGKVQELRLDTQVEKLAEALDPAVKLVIVDPITSYLGDAKMNAETEVRQVLAGLAELAAKYKLAIVTITHFNKKDSTDAKDRVMGARAFTGFPRVVWTFMKDPDDSEQRVMVPGKAEHLEGLRYQIVEATDEPSGNKVGVVCLGGAYKETGDSVLESHAEKPSERTKKDIVEYVLEYIEAAGGEVDAGHMKKLASEAFRVSERTVERAIKGKITAEQQGVGKAKRWKWKLLDTSSAPVLQF